MDRVTRTRLLKGAALLRKDAAKKRGICYSQNDWGEVGDPDAPLSCGTQACALGLFAISGAFRRQGLGYVLQEYLPGRQLVQFTWDGTQVEPDEAIEKLFPGLDSGIADDIFGYRSGALPRTGAAGERYTAKLMEQAAGRK